MPFGLTAIGHIATAAVKGRAAATAELSRRNCRGPAGALRLRAMRADPTPSLRIPSLRIPSLRILAGTRDAVRLAEAATHRFGDRVPVAVALAGAVPVPRGCRVDGIGVAASLPAGTAAVIDGLDPFDGEAVRTLRAAALAARVPRLAFRPPAWHRHPLDRWIEVRDLAGAVGAVAAVGRTVLLALPERDLAAFETTSGRHFAVRLTREPARWDRPLNFVPYICPPPHHRQSEARLLRRTRAEAVVIRATGDAGDAMLVAAARGLDLPIVMIRRPAERGEVPARSVAAALEWAESTFAGISPRAPGVPAWR